MTQPEKQSYQALVEKLSSPRAFSPSLFLYELRIDQPKIRSEQEVLEGSCVSQISWQEESIHLRWLVRTHLLDRTIYSGVGRGKGVSK